MSRCDCCAAMGLAVSMVTVPVETEEAEMGSGMLEKDVASIILEAFSSMPSTGSGKKIRVAEWSLLVESNESNEARINKVEKR